MFKHQTNHPGARSGKPRPRDAVQRRSRVESLERREVMSANPVCSVAPTAPASDAMQPGVVESLGGDNQGFAVESLSTQAMARTNGTFSAWVRVGVLYINAQAADHMITVSGDRNNLIVTSKTSLGAGAGGHDQVDRQAFKHQGVRQIVYVGTDGSDIFKNNTRIRSHIYGQGGHDTLIGGWGNDRIYGGGGSDRLEGRDGRDYLEGGRAGEGDQRDLLLGGNGRDTLVGGPGNDLMYGQGGRDTLYVESRSEVRENDPRDRIRYSYGLLLASQVDHTGAVDAAFYDLQVGLGGG